MSLMSLRSLNLDPRNGDADDGEEKEKFELKKHLGLWSGVSLTVVFVVGSGIFVSPVGVLKTVNGSVGASLLIWVLCGMIAMFSLFCYAEIGASLKTSGRDFYNFKLAYGVPVAFLYIWTDFILNFGSAATLQVFAAYLVTPFYGGCEPDPIVIKFIAIAMLFVIVYMNCRSVKLTVKSDIFFAVLKFLSMAVIAIGGIVFLCQGYEVGVNNFKNAFTAEGLGVVDPTQIGMAFYQGIFPYNGWFILTAVTEELRNPEVNLPRAGIIAMSCVTGIYLLVNIGYFAVLEPSEMLTSSAVAMSFAEKVLGKAAFLMPVSVCLSIIGTQIGSYYARSRQPFVASRIGQMPRIFSMIHVNYYTPTPAIIVMCVITIIYIFIGDFDTLIAAFGFTSWTFYGMNAASVLILRRKLPDLPRPYKVHWTIPVFVTLISIYFVISPLILNPSFVYFIAIGFEIICGFGYYIFLYKKIRLPGFDKMTIFLQKLLCVAETDWDGFDFEKEKTEEDKK